MPTDAKCGLLVGVGLVLTVAVLFFQKEPPADAPAAPPAAVVQTRTPVPATAAAVRPPADQEEPRESTLPSAVPVSRSGERGHP